MPKVSVVIPTWNASAHLDEALTSTLNQTLRDIEVLVIDSVSTDNTVEIVQGHQDERVRLIELPQRELPAFKRNLGFREACGEYIALMDADDIMVPKRLETQAAFMDARSDIHVSGSSFVSFSASGEINRMMSQRDSVIKAKLMLASASGLHGPTVILRRDYLLENDLFFPNAPVDEDHALWMAYMEAGAKFANLHQYLMRYRKHATSYTRTHADAYAKGKMKLRAEALQTFFPSLSPETSVTLAKTIGGKKPMGSMDVLNAVEAFEVLDQQPYPRFGADRATLFALLEPGRQHVQKAFKALKRTTPEKMLEIANTVRKASRAQTEELKS